MARTINAKMQAYILAGSGWTPAPPTPGAQTWVTQNITLYLTKNAATDAFGRSTRNAQLMGLMKAAAAS